MSFINISWLILFTSTEPAAIPAIKNGIDMHWVITSPAFHIPAHISWTSIIENKIVFQILDKITSLFRAIPFIILLAFINPVTYLLLKNTIGPTAALVPLSLAVFPFFARQVQVVLSELDGGVIEAAQASGATFWDIVGVYLREGLPDLIRVTTVTIISLIGETAMAGAVGAGGLGTLAINYGKNMFNNDVIFVATLLILILIVLVQFFGDFLSKKISHR